MRKFCAILAAILGIMVILPTVSAATGTYTTTASLDLYAFPDLSGSATIISSGESVEVKLELYEPVNDKWLVWVELSGGAFLWADASEFEAASRGYTAPSTAPAAPTPAGSSNQPLEQWCQLGVTTNTPGVTKHDLVWDSVQERGYMNSPLVNMIQSGPAFCLVEFPHEVTVLLDSIAVTNPGGSLKVDGTMVTGGNGITLTGTRFEFVYPSAAVSNGHAYIVQ